ncbi:hypothetical protein CPB85DRAFT_83308 [Mucidula mucida]|nr:hypothetical protein CPB85DRAFT_83308 [Mucidula mucida]
MQHDFERGDGSDIWVNVSMPRPPYWSEDWYGNGARDLSFSNYWDLLTGNDTGSMRVFLQPWGVQNRSYSNKDSWGSMPKTGVANQFVFALVSRRYEDLVVDSLGSPGKIHNSTAIMGPCASSCLYSDPPSFGLSCLHRLEAADIADCVRTLYTQVIGCSLETSTRSLNLTKSGLLSAKDTEIALGTPPPHEWSTFSWQNPQDSYDFLARELLNMLVPAICSSPRRNDALPYYQDAGYMQGVLTSIISSTVHLNEFEDALGNLTASYLWNVWQQCDSAFQFGTSYEQCNNGSSLRLTLASNSAEFTTTKTLARLEIVWWKSVVTVICSLILFCLAFMLLGTHSDTPSGQPHRQARFTETALLMKNSRIPDLLASGFKQDFPLR